MERQGASRGLLVILAAIVFAALVVQVALAGPASQDEATTSASVQRAVKSLKRQVARLKRRVGRLESRPGASGAAGGDLAGSYPAPVIAPNAVTTGKLGDGAVTSQDLAAELRPVRLRFFASDLDGNLDTVTTLASVFPGVDVKAECVEQDPGAELNFSVNLSEVAGISGFTTRVLDANPATTQLTDFGFPPDMDHVLVQGVANDITNSERIYASFTIVMGEISQPQRALMLSANMTTAGANNQCQLTGTAVPLGVLEP